MVGVVVAMVITTMHVNSYGNISKIHIVAITLAK